MSLTSAPGTVTVQESRTTGWKLVSITCSDPNGQATYTAVHRSVTVQLAQDETVDCTP